MTSLARLRLGLLLALVLIALDGACTHDYGSLQKADGGANCSVGTETCGCNPNRTCDIGLICYSNHCVQPGTGNGGTTGAGGFVIGGASGAGGAGGILGAGGTVGLGGVTGAAGVVGAGGILGTGGIIATGGVTGTGGSTPPVLNNQITNGDFSSGSSAPWGVTVTEPSGTTLSGAVTNGAFCVSIPSGSSTVYTVTIGWPASGSPVAALQAGVAYEFTYQASTTASIYSFQAKVGQATSPYTQVDFQTSADALTPGAGLQTFAHTFTPTVGDAVAGVAFNITTNYQTAATVCIDNVALGNPS